jgi:hypothetical protein
MRRLVHASLLIVAVALGACKQADGQMPTKTQDVPNRLSDIRRDLESIGSGDTQAVQDLSDDLTVFAAEADGITAARALATTVSPLLMKKTMNDDARTRMADLLWLTVAGHDLSERQADALKDDMRALLASLGVAPADANLVAGRMDTVHKAVSERPRRWYERY